jgi:hypothetical protein
MALNTILVQTNIDEFAEGRVKVAAISPIVSERP